MENERFKLKHAGNTVDMAASSSKVLQIARKMDRTGNQKNIPQRKKNNEEFRTLIWLYILFGIGKGANEEMKTKYHKKGNAEKLRAHSAAFNSGLYVLI